MLKEPAQVTQIQNVTAPWPASQKLDTGDTPAQSCSALTRGHTNTNLFK